VNTGHRIVYPFSDDEVKQQIQEEVGIKPEFALEAFSDLEKDVRQPIRRI
jgi:carbonic anhydrase